MWYPEGSQTDKRPALLVTCCCVLRPPHPALRDLRGTCRYIARKFGSQTLGITLSPNQARRANELAEAGGLVDQCRFEVADALKQPFADRTFDFVWSMESGEHMPDKRCARCAAGTCCLCQP